MKDSFTSYEKHPAEKSLSVFPIISPQQRHLLKNSPYYNNERAAGQPHCSVDRKIAVQLRDNLDAEYSGTFQQEIRITSNKLDRATKHLPTSHRPSNPLQLPSIKAQPTKEKVVITGKRQLSQEAPTKGYKAFVLPVVSREKCGCTCSRGELTNVKLKRLARLFRPEETPPLFSIYVRWKNRRDGTVQYNHHSLLEIFQNFGNISNILFKSQNSAIIVYMNVESACTAANVMEKVGRDMRFHVQWLNDIK